MTSPSEHGDTARQKIASNVLAPVIAFLRQHAPFDRMEPADLEFLAQHSALGFYAKGEVVTTPGDGIAERFYIIKQGRIRGESEVESGPSEEGAWELIAGESFPIGALLAKRPVRTTHRAVEDTFCFELPRAEFETLLARSPQFHDFCTRRLANLLDQTLQDVQASVAAAVTGDASLNAPAGSLVRREPVTCAPTTPLREALRRMNDERVGSIVVIDEKVHPVGVFTLHDLLGRVVTSDVSLAAPIRDVMTLEPLSLPPEAFAFEAALLMIERGFRHVCVVKDDRLVGVLSERDLFSLQRTGLVKLSEAINRAPDVATLARLGRDVDRLIDQMLVQGVSVTQLTQIITLLNDLTTRRAIALCLADDGAPSVRFAWLAFGSEGRREQTMRTDQDNGIIFAPPSGESADTARSQLLAFARRINQALAECGYPQCEDGVMASNPECCLSAEEWRRRFDDWIEHDAPGHLFKAGIFFDFRALYGDQGPAADLREWITPRIADSPRFLRRVAEDALRSSPPLGLARDFVVATGGGHPHTIDLKTHGLTPFVDGARLLALAHRITETNTQARLRMAAAAGVVSWDEAEAWCNAYAYVQLLRMRMHQSQQREGKPLDNRIDLGTLNELDRRVLKEAFRQARKLQTRIALDYQL